MKTDWPSMASPNRNTYDALDQLTGKRVRTQFNTSGTPTNRSRYEVFAWADGQEVFRFVDSDGQGAQPARIANRYLNLTAVDQLLQVWRATWTARTMCSPLVRTSRERFARMVPAVGEPPWLFELIRESISFSN